MSSCRLFRAAGRLASTLLRSGLRSRRGDRAPRLRRRFGPGLLFPRRARCARTRFANAAPANGTDGPKSASNKLEAAVNELTLPPHSRTSRRPRKATARRPCAAGFQLIGVFDVPKSLTGLPPCGAPMTFSSATSGAWCITGWKVLRRPAAPLGGSAVRRDGHPYYQRATAGCIGRAHP